MTCGASGGNHKPKDDFKCNSCLQSTAGPDSDPANLPTPPSCLTPSNSLENGSVNTDTRVDNDTSPSSSPAAAGADDLAEVASIVCHAGKPPNRRFRIKYVDGTESWLNEKECDNCLDLLKIYIAQKGLAATKVKHPKKCGSLGGVLEEQNFVSVDDVIKLARKNLRSQSMQPVLFDEPDRSQDGLFVMQIGSHCFAVLYLCESKTCIIADGANVSATDRIAHDMVHTHIPDAKLVPLPFIGQNRPDKCASSCIAIMVELEKIYRSRVIPDKLMPEKRLFKELNKKLHPVYTPPTTGRWRINQTSIGVECPKCGRRWLRQKNRAVLNLHKCKQ